MTSLRLTEVDVVQNAAFGAMLIWRFGLAYQEQRIDPPSVLSTFLVLPVCLHLDTVRTVNTTRRSSGLTLFAAKLGENREDLLAVHTRALNLRMLSLRSLGAGVEAGLMSIDYQSATVRSNALKEPAVPERIKPHVDAASRFGYWCAGLEIAQIAHLLRVSF